MAEEYAIIGESDDLPPKEKLRWNCRRGMKELEVVLLPFLEYCYDQYEEPQQRLFVRLLGFDDASLYSWFMGYEDALTPELTQMIQEVQSAVAKAVASGADVSRFH